MALVRSDAPTLVDVAQEAEVSLKTASRVLNNSKNVSQDKVLRVRQAMERLGYRPNELARGLKAQRSAAIGMIVPNLSDPFTANAVHGLQEVARANGYAVILASSGGDVDVERSEIETLVSRQVDGLVIAPADSRKDSFTDIIPASVHVVTFDQLIRNVELDTVTVTNRRSAQQATEHLASHGCRRIVAIGARPYLYTCKERIAGYKAGMKAAALPPRMCLVDHESSLTADWLKKEVFQNQKADAIFTLNWVCTTLTLRGLRTLGKTAGRDIPLFSFDDFDLADMLTPALSVVQQPAEILGREAARLLFERLKGSGGKFRAVVVPTSLVIRHSCGC
ncbi:LacI family DNA-binding transcriptional regulator [Tunturiibacter lichenicola]|jgi:LacI family transcriptional regulator|uniref:LacI family DNA-binding transcriptional regulator n=1 Tax=Tunturiibacter lichenicola TaxID=2051959 RepID=UPI0021B20E02|nr:LacI family DNA-binding transcriptional regulator [Edaphobacter lichenicola]